MTQTKRRILLIDDTINIHDDFRKILADNKSDIEFEKTKSLLFSTSESSVINSIELPTYDIDSAYQGKEGFELVKKAYMDGQPYALAFVDVRMTPGWDGIETIKHIWQVDPEIQVVICTAHSDYSWEKIAYELKAKDNFLILKKPFDPIEIVQLASSLIKKWELKQLLLQQIDNLEKTVQHRTADLRKAKELAEQANKIKSDFLRNMSHELFTPLNGIVGFANLLSEGKISPEDQKDCFKTILSSANHLLQLINDIFYFSTIETHEFENNFTPEDINLPKLVNDVKELHDHIIKEKQFEFTIEVEPATQTFRSDLIQFKRVLFHLISNAVKFTPAKGKIKVHAFVDKNKSLRIEVIDSGIGIKKEDMSKLFVPFQQLDSSMAKKYQGLGIGLALVRKIIESQGGEVGIVNNEGAGCTFFIVLPR